MSDTLMAIIAAFAIIAAVLMAALAYRLNEKWCERNMEWHELCREQNDFMKRMNHEWYDAYVKMVNMKAEAAENERD